MNKFSNFLLKLFVVTVALFCLAEYNARGEETSDTITVIEDTDDHTLAEKAPNCDYSTTTPADTKTYQICPEGSFLYSCNGFVIGTSWLKSMNYSLEKTKFDISQNASGTFYNTTPTTSTTIRKTTNYYDESDEDMVNLKNLKIFFKASETAENGGIISYANSTTNNQITFIAPTVYKVSRDMILSQFCNPLKASFVCASCPGIGTVKESTVKISDNKILCNTWDIYTFADCYVKTFEDSTGTYEYRSESSEKAQECSYYNTNSNQIYGTELVTSETQNLNNVNKSFSNKPYVDANMVNLK